MKRLAERPREPLDATPKQQERGKNGGTPEDDAAPMRPKKPFGFLISGDFNQGFTMREDRAHPLDLTPIKPGSGFRRLLQRFKNFQNLPIRRGMLRHVFSFRGGRTRIGGQRRMPHLFCIVQNKSVDNHPKR